MGMTRKRFLHGAAGGTVILLIQGCGGGGGYSGGTAMGGIYPNGATCGGAAISNNHGHALGIPSTDLTSMTDMTYSIRGTADHDHTITLTPAQLTTIKNGGSVNVTSTVTTTAAFGTHSHVVTVNCM